MCSFLIFFIVVVFKLATNTSDNSADYWGARAQGDSEAEGERNQEHHQGCGQVSMELGAKCGHKYFGLRN
jgi:hypothetical protein